MIPNIYAEMTVNVMQKQCDFIQENAFILLNEN